MLKAYVPKATAAIKLFLRRTLQVSILCSPTLRPAQVDKLQNNNVPGDCQAEPVEALMKKAPTVQECDARNDAINTKAGYNKALIDALPM